MSMTCDRLNPSSSMRAIAAESTRSARVAVGDCAAASVAALRTTRGNVATSAADKSVAARAAPIIRRDDGRAAGIDERTSGVLDMGDVSCTRRAAPALADALAPVGRLLATQ